MVASFSFSQAYSSKSYLRVLVTVGISSFKKGESATLDQTLWVIGLIRYKNCYCLNCLPLYLNLARLHPLHSPKSLQDQTSAETWEVADG